MSSAATSSANIVSAVDEAHRLVKRQKTTEAGVSQCISKLLEVLQAGAVELASDENCMDPDIAVAELSRKLGDLSALKDISEKTKELHASVNKLSKALDKAFDGQPDICRALRDVQFDQPTLNQVIAEHLYREGRFEVGDTFMLEAGLVGADSLKQPFIAMHMVLEQIRQHDLSPALAWAVEHRAQLSPSGQPSPFEFRLHSLAFLNLLATKGERAALQYAKAHFQAFQASHMKEIQRLMGCLLFAKRPASSLGRLPYADLLSAQQWDEAADAFIKLSCGLMGQACESPLTVAVAAGASALPALLKLAAVCEKNGQDLRTCEQLPFELELGNEFVFHSIFACPVSRDQSSADNQPMLLPCNHVLCEQSVLKIAKSRTRIFKCPYCPMEARADNLRPLIFPDLE